MDSIQPAVTGKKMLWAGRIMSGLPALFFLFGGVMDLLKPEFVVQGVTKAGYPESCIVGLGIVTLISTVLYLIPATAVLGAILLTGYLGGAVATHVRMSASWGEILFPVFFGILVWGGLFLRDSRIRALIPVRRY